MVFAVQDPGDDFAVAIRNKLAEVGKIEIDEIKGSVLLETSVPWNDIQRRIEATGRRTLLTGFGGQSAVAMVDHDNGQTDVRGVVRFCSIPTASSATGRGVVVDGIIEGLANNRKYLLNVHECGDISKGCASVGDVYNSVEVNSDSNGKAAIRFVYEQLELADLIGRSVVIADPQNSQRRLSCGIIARSAGVLECSKQICTCDGVTICDARKKSDAWEEEPRETKEDCIQVCMDCCWEMRDLIGCLALCFRQSLFHMMRG
ncbi:copper chaperone for superoxide dismutase-like [Anopheles aquasalis]|uniref:copper chaperone for superoxide dismutase-like n=1 Tax=Anopheles aquasalis TaxID=42839 RepID=UPI00215AC71C|nr:copper chaperone for superoxide dismutase-like [Anopheles aquasalis]